MSCFRQDCNCVEWHQFINPIYRHDLCIVTCYNYWIPLMSFSWSSSERCYINLWFKLQKYWCGGWLVFCGRSLMWKLLRYQVLIFDVDCMSLLLHQGYEFQCIVWNQHMPGNARHCHKHFWLYMELIVFTTLMHKTETKFLILTLVRRCVSDFGNVSILIASKY